MIFSSDTYLRFSIGHPGLVSMFSHLHCGRSQLTNECHDASKLVSRLMNDDATAPTTSMGIQKPVSSFIRAILINMNDLTISKKPLCESGAGGW